MKSTHVIVSITLLYICMSQPLFGANISGITGGKSQAITAENIAGILNTRFGGLFPSDKNLVTINYKSKELVEAIELWNKRVDDLSAIVTKLNSKHTAELNRLIRVNRDILSALQDNCTKNIFPAVQAAQQKNTYWNPSELNLAKINATGMQLTLNTVCITSQRVIEDVLKKLKALEPTSTITKALEFKKTRQARNLLETFAEFLSIACSKIENDLQKLSEKITH
jgi:hypothetical protein